MITVSSKWRLGFAQIPVILGLALMAVTLPLVNKLVSQNQENRSQASVWECDGAADCGNGYSCIGHQCVQSCSCGGEEYVCSGVTFNDSCGQPICTGSRNCTPTNTPAPNPTNPPSCVSTGCPSSDSVCAGQSYTDNCSNFCGYGNKNCSSQTYACGASETQCDGTTKVKVCNSDRSGWITTDCLPGYSCSGGICRPPAPTNTPPSTPTPTTASLPARCNTWGGWYPVGFSCVRSSSNWPDDDCVCCQFGSSADVWGNYHCNQGSAASTPTPTCTGGKVWSDPDFTGIYSCNCPAGKVWSDPDFTGIYSCNSIISTLTLTPTPTPITTIRPSVSPTAGAATPTSSSCLPGGYQAPDGDASLCCSKRVSGNTCLSGSPPTPTPTPFCNDPTYYSEHLYECSPLSPTKIPAPTAAATGRPNTTPQPTSAPQPPPGGGNGTPGTGGSCGRSISIRMQSSASDPLTLNKAITVGQSLTLLCVKTGEVLEQTDTRIVVTRPGANREEYAGPRKNNWTPTVAGAYTIFCEDLSCSNKQSVDTAIVSVAASGTGACKTCPNDFKCYQSSNYLKYGFFTSAYIPDGFEKTSVPDDYCQNYGGLTKPNWQGKIKGDANCDGVIGVQDTSIWRKEYAQSRLQTSLSANWESDFNCDGKVDMTDYNNWKSSYVNMRRGQ